MNKLKLTLLMVILFILSFEADNILILIAVADIVSYLFGVSSPEFCKAITRPRVKVGNEFVNKGQNMEQVKFKLFN